MHILVIGASGMAGHLITTYLRENNYAVSTLAAHHPLDQDTVLIDVCNLSRLNDYLSTHHFDIIVNCAGILIEASEANKATSIFVNAYFPHYLETLYKYTSTRIIHLSTDCVFSGTCGPYVENSPYDSTSFYGRTKALGEICNTKDLTFRMSIIGPDFNPNGVGLFNWFFKQKNNIHGYMNAYWNGITTLELAKAINAAIHQNITGLYHLVPNEIITKYNLLLLFKQTFNKSNLTISPEVKPISNKTLVSTRNDFNYQVSNYSKMLQELATWIEKHPTLYPHYMMT